MSVRSLTTMRPYLVSIKIVFCGSTPAGSGWANAGAAVTSAANKTRTRIMKSPGGLSSWVSAGLAGELLFQADGDRGRHEGRDIAAHGRNLAHQCGSDRTHAGRCGQKYRLYLRRHRAVHARHLHFVVEVRAIAQAADQHAGAGAARRRNGEIGKGDAGEFATRGLNDRA